MCGWVLCVMCLASCCIMALFGFFLLWHPKMRYYHPFWLYGIELITLSGTYICSLTPFLFQYDFFYELNMAILAPFVGGERSTRTKATFLFVANYL